MNMTTKMIQQLNLRPDEHELLQLAGFESIEDIEQWELSRFISKIQQTNKTHEILQSEFSSANIKRWWKSAVEKKSSRAKHSAPSDVVNFELDPEVMEMMRNAPLAEALSTRTLAAKNVPVSAIPIAVLLTEVHGDISVRVSTKSQQKSQVTSLATSAIGHVNSISLSRKKEDIDLSRIKTLQAHSDIAPLPKADFNIVTTTRPETNKGVSTDSRRFIRGVLHPKPAFVWWGALFTLITQFAIPLGIVSMTLLLLRDQKHETFSWVPSWFLAFPISVFAFGILYLTISYNCSCCICGQKLYVPKRCLKNKKAHRIPFLGFIFPIALHTVLFRWFRCSHCGTAMRLKK
jgi:hypothetical protein